MKHQVAHGLGRADARKAVHAAFESYQARFAQYQPKVDWVTADLAMVSFTAKGRTFDGSLAVTDTTFVLDLDVPFLLRPFLGQALGTVEAEIGRWVDAARAGRL